MRILCNGLGWFDAAAAEARAEHDIVIATDDVVARAWTSGRSNWWRDAAPPGWEPEVAIFNCPEYRLMPPALAELSCPVALWVGDWYANADALHALAPQADLILADATGVEALRRTGVEHVDECSPWTFDPELHRPDWDAPAVRDVGFLGHANNAIQHERNRWLARMASLPDRYVVHAATRQYGEEYVRYIQQSRLTFNRSLTGDVNMRCFEAAACGSLVLIDRESLPQVSRWFEPGREVVAYGDDDFEQVVEHYLEHEDERLAIARAGHERVQQHAPAPRLRRLLARLEQLRSAGISRQLTCMTPAAHAAAAVQTLALACRPPWDGVERAFEQSEGEGLAEPALHVNRAALYYCYATESRAADASQGVSWANQQLSRALELDPGDAVAMLDRIELARGLGASEAVGTAARELAERIEAGSAHASPGRLVLPLTVSRLRFAWQAAILSGSDVDAQLAPLVLGEAYRLAAAAEDDAHSQAELYERSLACFATPETRQLRVVALLRGGDNSAALAELETLLEECPLTPGMWLAFTGLLLAAGRADDARDFVDWCELLAARIEFVDERVASRLREELPTPVAA